MKIYFAYGSNMNFDQMALRAPSSCFISVGFIKNNQFIINSNGVASLIRKENSRVYGALWKLNEDDLINLDKFEGLHKQIYKRVEGTVFDSNNHQTLAQIYIASDSTFGQPRLGYLEKIIESAKSLQFDNQYIEELKTWMPE